MKIVKGGLRHLVEQWKKFYNNKGFIILLGVAFFSIPFVVHGQSILAGNTLVAGDGILALHNQIYLGESIRNFDFPLWTPYIAGGMPFAQDMSQNILYPLTWICSLLPTLIQLCTYFGIHYALGGVFLFLYLQQLDCSRIVSLSMSVIYLFTVHMGGARKEHVPLIVASLYLPVILYLIEQYLIDCKMKCATLLWQKKIAHNADFV